MKNYKNITKLLDITRPYKMGDKLLILATAPSTALFFEKESVRKQFEEYDVAFLNKMILCSPKETQMIKPKYFIFMDGVFYDDDYYGTGTVNERKKAVESALESVTWDCYVISPILAEYNVNNEHVKYIKMGIFYKNYSRLYRGLYKKNYFNPGSNTVVMGAIYYGITFGYKEIGILGFSYRSGKIYMREDGLYVDEYLHYYDDEQKTNIIPYDQIMVEGESFTLRRAKRAVESCKILHSLARYADDMGVEVTNYTPDNMVDVFKAGKLML